MCLHYTRQHDRYHHIQLLVYKVLLTQLILSEEITLSVNTVQLDIGALEIHSHRCMSSVVTIDRVTFQA